MSKVTVKTNCPSCRGTGLYQGFAEADGEPVVCLSCNGSGCKTISYEPYVGRKRKNGVKKIRLSRGSFIGTGIGGMNNTEMTYQEFREKFPEESV